MLLKIKRSRVPRLSDSGEIIEPREYPIVDVDVVELGAENAAKARAVNNNKNPNRVFDIEIVEEPDELTRFLAIDRSVDVDAIARTLVALRDQIRAQAATLDQLAAECRAELAAQAASRK